MSVQALTAFVGRERELAELRAALAEAAAGHGRMLMLVGEPGVGKTSLADALCAEAEEEGARVLWGRCWEGGGAPAYWPWVQVIRSYARDAPTERFAAPAGAAAIAQLVPELRERVPDLPEAGSPDSERARFALFDAVTTLLIEAAAAKAVVLILDNLHAADRASLLLLRFLAGELRTARLLVVGTYRELEARFRAETAQDLSELARESRRIPLRGLSEEAVASYIEEAAGATVGAGVVRAIHEATQGNPFFVDEVVRLLVAEGRLERAEGSRLGSFRIPDGVRNAIRQRLADLPEETVEALRVASVVGREFTLAALKPVVSAPLERLVELLDPAAAAAIVAEAPGRLTGYTFAHTLVRDTLYEDLAPTRRARLHREVGEALEELYAADPEPRLAELAHHFLEAAATGEAERAIDYSRRAGDRALAQLAFEEAARHYSRALQALELEDPSDQARRCDLLLALGQAQSRAADTKAARESFMSAADLARRLGSADRLARAALGYGAGLGGFEFGVVDEPLVSLLEEARRGLGEKDSALLARVIGRLAVELYYSASTDERASLSGEAVEMARRVGDTSTLASALSARHLALWGPDNVDERLAAATEIVRLGDQTGDVELMLRGHLWRLVGFAELGRIQAVDTELEHHCRLAERLRDPLYLWYTPLLRAMRAVFEGRLDEGEELSREALAVGQGAQPENAQQLFAAQTFAALWARGRLDEVEAPLADLVQRYRANPVWRAALAFVYSELDRQNDARAQLDQLAADDFAALPRDGEWLPGITLLADVAGRLGDADRSAALYDLLLPYADRNVVTGRAAACFGSASRSLGVLATALGRFAEAERHLETGLRRNIEMGARPFAALASHDYAAMLLARGEPGDLERAGDLVRQALGTAEKLEMKGLRGRLEALRHEAGPPAAPAGAPARQVPDRASRPAEPAPPAGPTFRREGEYWTIAYRGPAFRLRDSKGLRHLARLIASPDDEFHAIDLVAAEEGRAPAPARPAAEPDALGVRHAGQDDAGEILDPQAKAAYKRRLTDLRDELEEAESWGDPERAAAARQEIDFLTEELAGAVGLGGRDRRAASASERARVNVTRSIKSAIQKIGEQDADLARHLGAAVRTGTFCSYAPEQRAAVPWEVSLGA